MKFERENLCGAKTPQMGDRLSRRQQNVFRIFFRGRMINQIMRNVLIFYLIFDVKNCLTYKK